ncbi:hypothetical protein B0O99DRAFT_595989 [Bisporella sp. PMI_857]|nr:hypothetical protein B0O99DRAFT_595989 [Bisporella sp. PMI_857]
MTDQASLDSICPELLELSKPWLEGISIIHVDFFIKDTDDIGTLVPPWKNQITILYCVPSHALFGEAVKTWSSECFRAFYSEDPKYGAEDLRICFLQGCESWGQARGCTSGAQQVYIQTRRSFRARIACREAPKYTWQNAGDDISGIFQQGRNFDTMAIIRRAMGSQSPMVRWHVDKIASI